LNQLLQEFLTSPTNSGQALETLLFEHAEPLIRRIVWRRLSGSISVQDREDTTGDALVELLARLESWKRGESKSIENFPAYTAVIAHHACDHYLRGLFPRKYRMRTRLRYLLESGDQYAIWDLEAETVCGYARQTGQAPSRLDDPSWRNNVSVPPGSSEAEILKAIFAEVSPLRFDDVSDAMAHLTGLRDDTAVDWQEIEAVIPTRPIDHGEKIDHRRALKQLWEEISELPLPQRIALLLNLRDENGNSPLANFQAVGVASLRDIARVLEMPPEELAKLWGKLPVSDLDIAEKLNLTRQQVINLRKAARQRLARRTAGNITEVSAPLEERSKTQAKKDTRRA
jgi:DNA-directed RNA polymerase specialized sigma24 family protein